MIRDVLRQLADDSWWSDDCHTQNAAIILPPRCVYGAAATNAVPPRLEATDERCRPPLKTDYIEHAERAAIYAAARDGFITSGCIMVALWAACPECARAIISAGITAVHVANATLEATPPRWLRQVNLGIAMLHEAGIPVTTHRSLGRDIRFDGRILTL